MKKAKPVRQQWVFDEGWSDLNDVTMRDGSMLEAIPSLGHPRNLFDENNALVRKVSLSDVERASLGENGALVLKQMLQNAAVDILVIVDDRPSSENPIINEYEASILRGIASVVTRYGVEVALANTST